MAWFRVDDSFHGHPKVLAIPRRQRLAVVGLWTTAGSWCAFHLTDGHFHCNLVTEWGALSRHATVLVDVGLWEAPTSQTFAFHDWLQWQPSRESVLEKRAKEAKRKADYREKRRTCPTGTTTGVPLGQNAESRTSPAGVPAGVPPLPTRPDPTRPLLPTGVEKSGQSPAATTESAQPLVGEWIDHCGPDARPPRSVIGQVSKQLKGLLDEGIPYADVRAGLVVWHEKRLHPSTLPSIVHEERIGPGRPASKRSTTDERVAQTLTDVLPRMAALDAAEAEANRRSLT